MNCRKRRSRAKEGTKKEIAVQESGGGSYHRECSQAHQLNEALHVRGGSRMAISPVPPPSWRNGPDCSAVGAIPFNIGRWAVNLSLYFTWPANLPLRIFAASRRAARPRACSRPRARVTASVPILLPARGRLSMTNGCPSRLITIDQSSARQCRKRHPRQGRRRCALAASDRWGVAGRAVISDPMGLNAKNTLCEALQEQIAR
jgi:hypothetical protein